MFSNFILQLIVFFLPTQLGLHFWPAFSRAAGVKVDYLSPTLYFVDILLIIYIVINLKGVSQWLVHHLLPVGFFVFYILLNSFFGVSPLNSAFWWLRWVLYLLFFLVLRLRKVTWLQLRRPLLISTTIIIILEVLQLFGQSSVGGLFYWLGERAFSSSTPGLGRLSLFGLDFVRPQASFSHPNSLAGYLLVIYYLLHLYKSPSFSRIFVFLGLIFTFSKAALLAFLLVVILQINSLSLIYVFACLAIIQILLPNFPNTFQFISDRFFLLVFTKKIIISKPLFGVGLGSFIPALVTELPGSFLVPAKLQPVHNLLLLFLSELGLIGTAIFGLILKINLKKVLRPRFLGLVTLVVITGAFDHYWWTLPQNKLLLLLASSLLL